MMFLWRRGDGTEGRGRRGQPWCTSCDTRHQRESRGPLWPIRNGRDLNQNVVQIQNVWKNTGQTPVTLPLLSQPAVMSVTSQSPAALYSSFMSLFFSSSVLFTLKSTLYLYCEERFINKLTYLVESPSQSRLVWSICSASTFNGTSH